MGRFNNYNQMMKFVEAGTGHVLYASSEKVVNKYAEDKDCETFFHVSNEFINTARLSKLSKGLYTPNVEW